MNITVLGATGAVGSRVVHEALDRGHRVRALVRHPARAAALPHGAEAVVADALDPVALRAALHGQDRAISALRPPPGREPELVDLTRAVLDAGAAAGVPLVLVGGAATLRLPEDPDHTVLTAPGLLPPAVRPIAEACAAQRAVVLGRSDAVWSHLCPPAELAPGPRTGHYRLGADTLLVDATGRSRISMEDLAVALVDEAESGAHTGRSFTVAW